MLYGRLVHVGETLTDLQILGCELQKNAFGAWNLWMSYSALPDALAVIRGRGRREGEERVRNSREGGVGRTGRT